ncbi:MAG: uncharacterized protein JWO30_3044 [Fibrobacteres bacterium]|nr:uncharacterized protein [Fibrobacterota bacterium]
MVDQELLDMLCCPETKEDVSLAAMGIIEDLNRKVEAGQLRNRGGEIVKEKMDSGLIRADRKYLYPIREDIPIMLIDEAIPLEGLI